MRIGMNTLLSGLFKGCRYELKGQSAKLEQEVKHDVFRGKDEKDNKNGKDKKDETPDFGLQPSSHRSL